MKKYIQFTLEMELFLIISLYIFPIVSSNIYPIYKLIITSNLNHVNVTNLRNYINYSLNTKGIGIKFDYNSEINIIPYHLFNQLRKIILIYTDGNLFVKDKGNNFQELLLIGYIDNIISFHFITENIGITIPNNVLFPFNISDIGKSTFTFLTKENQENIIIGKTLMDLMKIEFKDKNAFIIKNDEFISKVNDEI